MVVHSTPSLFNEQAVIHSKYKSIESVSIDFRSFSKDFDIYKNVLVITIQHLTWAFVLKITLYKYLNILFI